MIKVKPEKPIPVKNIETSSDKIHIWLRADVHFGSEDHDASYHTEYLKWFNSSPDHYDIWLGDICDFAVPTARKYKYMASQLFKSSYQWQIFERWLSENHEKHLIVLPGNHEFGRVIHYTSLFDGDLIDNTCKKYNVLYSLKNTYFKLNIKSQKNGKSFNTGYLFYLSHGRSSAATDDYILRQLIEKGIADAADFVIVGHTHHNNSKTYYRNYVNHDSIGVKKIEGIRPGSFQSEPLYISFDRPRPSPDGNGILELRTDLTDYVYYENLDDWRIKNGEY